MSVETGNSKQAVALRYDGHGAPRVKARGEHWLADQILELAREHDIPIHHDANLVALLARVELDEEIPESLWEAVAQVLAFVARLDMQIRTGQRSR